MNDLTTEQDNSPTKLFQNKIAERIQADMGNLMPDEMLQQIVQESVKSILYRKIPGKNTWDSPKEWIVDAVNSRINHKIASTVDTIVKEHESEIKDHIAQVFKDQFPDILASVVVRMLTNNMAHLHSEIYNTIQRSRV